MTGGAFRGAGDEPSPIRTESNLRELHSRGARVGDLAASIRIERAEKFFGRDDHPFSIRAECHGQTPVDNRTAARLAQQGEMPPGRRVPKAKPALDRPGRLLVRDDPPAVGTVEQVHGSSAAHDELFLSGRRIPDHDIPVGGPAGEPTAIEGVFDRSHFAGMPAQDRAGPAGGCFEQVDLALKVPDGDLPGVGAEPNGQVVDLGHRQYEARAIELAGKVAPLPVAVLLGRGLQRTLPRAAILQLLSGGGLGDIRAIALPTLGPLSRRGQVADLIGLRT